MKKIILIILVMVILSGCVGERKRLPNSHIVASGLIADVTRFEDDYYKVTCWIYRNGYAGGLACIPTDQLEEK